MHKKSLVIFLLCFSVVLILLTVLFSFVFSALPEQDIYIYENITECEELRALGGETGTFTEYAVPKNDGNLGDLSYASCFAGKYLCVDYDFEIFAYEFEDEESARVYFKNCTGKANSGRTQNFSLSLGLTRARLAVMKDTKAYIVLCSTEDIESRTLQMVCSLEIGLQASHSNFKLSSDGM